MESEPVTCGNNLVAVTVNDHNVLIRIDCT